MFLIDTKQAKFPYWGNITIDLLILLYIFAGKKFGRSTILENINVEEKTIPSKYEKIMSTKTEPLLVCGFDLKV